ncbi:phage antirepressor KilAC domain-containing protein [Clostridiaceae bacterium NSJ-31]|uniref:Phage antirepressor KilAC domain-containing protein n=1 Tax=Ligaoa zhengdingensis TaxID=2763658 RepID=A0A926DZR6_9FIRM|nr:BRO family protein [Ligaoa zhengdingensis]MBC8546449.1 phage antirepressor KilAC domain-containing protein [Ligaoa zhengdingensis]
MNELQIFEYQNNEVRTIERGGEPWFVLKDVCKILNIGNPADVYNRLDDDEKGVGQIDTLGGTQKANIVNESGLYNVILRSDKPEAKPFRKWVTSEVLPSIRKHGAYMTPETLEAAIFNPDTIIRIATALKEEQDKRKALEATNAALTVDNQIMKPKAEYFDELVDRNLLTNFRETAKQLEVGEREFIRFLLDKKFIYRDKKGKLLPYADKNNGLFEIKECYNEKTQWSGTQTLVTPKGRETFRLLYLKAA